MMRGSRAGEGSPVRVSLRDSSRSYHELLLAVSPLPDALEFRVADWPQWLLPGQLSLSRALHGRPSERAHH
jgi:hypothetical protein